MAGRRQREEETIWRGNQWVRAVRVYYHKTGRYAPTAEDLEKGNGQVHFLRSAAYQNPMGDDGSWRFIYTNTSGQLIGSVRYANLQQMAMIDLGLNPVPSGSTSGSSASGGNADAADNSTSSDSTTAAAPPPTSSSSTTQTSASPAPLGSAASGNGSVGSSSTTTDNNNNQGSQETDAATSGASQGLGAATPDNSSALPAPTNQPTNAPPSTSSGFLTALLGNGGAASLDALAKLKPTGAVNGPVLGAFVTGVGGTADRKSIQIYHKGKTYKEWEFIWNPLEDQAQDLRQQLNNPGRIRI